MIVDALEGEEELVIKALDDRTVETDLVSGASILGDGRVVLILNLASVLERSNKRSHNRQRRIFLRTTAYASRSCHVQQVTSEVQQ